MLHAKRSQIPTKTPYGCKKKLQPRPEKAVTKKMCDQKGPPFFTARVFLVGKLQCLLL